MSKKQVTVEFYNNSGEQQYTGRCIGLLSETEFNAIINKPSLQKKLITVKTAPLVDVAGIENIEGLRLAIVVKNKQSLFITESIEMISQFITPDNLTLIGTEGSYITVIEDTEDA